MNAGEAVLLEIISPREDISPKRLCGRVCGTDWLKQTALIGTEPRGLYVVCNDPKHPAYGYCTSPALRNAGITVRVILPETDHE